MEGSGTPDNPSDFRSTPHPNRASGEAPTVGFEPGRDLPADLAGFELGEYVVVDASAAPNPAMLAQRGRLAVASPNGPAIPDNHPYYRAGFQLIGASD